MELIDKRCSQCNFYKCNIHTFLINNINQQILKCVCSLMDYIWKNKNRKAIEIFIKLLLLIVDDKKENNYKIEQLIEKLVFVILNEKDILFINGKEISVNEENTNENGDIIKNEVIKDKEKSISEKYITSKIIKSWIKENLNSISFEHLNFILNKLNWYMQCLIFDSNELHLKELNGEF